MLQRLGDAFDKTFRVSSESSRDDITEVNRNNNKKKRKKISGPPGVHKQKSAEEMYAEYKSQNKQFKFWSYGEYKSLKEKIGIPTHDSQYSHDREISLVIFIDCCMCSSFVIVLLFYNTYM